jgi:hypothetical protein
MSKRTVEEIQREYSNLCAKAGHVYYQIATLEKDLELVTASLRDLNIEAATAAKEAAASAPAAEGAAS